MLEHYNHAIFLSINAAAGLHGWPLALAVGAAEWLVLAIPAVLLLLWFGGGGAQRFAAVTAALSAGLALLINQATGLAYFHPRPFMEGVGHTFLVHAAENSFPSDHGAVMFAVALGLLVPVATRAAGWAMLAVALTVAWSRIYLGVHYPFDMAGAFTSALLAQMLLATAPGRAVAARGLGLAEAVSGRLFK